MSLLNFYNWTFGAEHELADWDIHTKLPSRYVRDIKDITIVNSNGIANDPTGKFYNYGGEINTPPTKTTVGQILCLQELKELLPEAKVNYRSNLHIHIRVPGLKEDLSALKKLQKYIHENMPRAFPLIQPLPRPVKSQYRDEEVFKGAVRRWRRRKVSHQTLLTQERIERQLKATTIEQFFNLEPPQSKEGKPLWHCQPRVCVNLRQLLETDTVEFRHFAGTLCEDELRTCLHWAEEFMQYALSNKNFNNLLESFIEEKFPTFPEYDHELEKRYRATVHDGTVDKLQISRNIKLILEGKYK